MEYTYCKKTGRLLNAQGKEVGYIHGKGKTHQYRRISIKGKDHGAHRVIWEMHNGKIPKGMVIDHIDGNGLNNRLENLRLATRAQNSMNRKLNVNSLSGYKGVTKAIGRNGSTLKNPWRVWMKCGDTIYTKHGFKTPKDAARHYNEKAIEFFGEFANLNPV